MKLVNPALGFAPVRRRKNRNASNISSNVARYQTTCVPRNNGFVGGEVYESMVKFLIVKIFDDLYFFGFGTFAPRFLASDNPMAIACSRLVTRFPLRPLFSSPRL